MRVQGAAGGGQSRGVEALDEGTLRAYWAKLFDFVQWRAAFLFGWLHLERGSNLVLGQSCEDIVQAALESLFGPPQQWNPTERPDPWHHLVWVARSKLIALARRTGRHAAANEEFVHDADASTIADNLEFSPEDAAAFDEFTSAVESAILEENDELLLRLYEIAEGTGDLSPSRVAKVLGISVREVDNLKERLKRLFDRIRADLNPSTTEGRP